MRRIKKKDIMATVLSVCILTVADPFLQSGLLRAEVKNNMDIVQLGVIAPESIADYLAQLTGNMKEVMESAKEEESVSIPYVPAPTEVPAQPTKPVYKPNPNEAIFVEFEVNGDDVDRTQLLQKPERDFSEMSLEEKKLYILNMLNGIGMFSFDWNGKRITITYDDYIYLCKLVQREAVGEDLIGRTLVANVVFNRVAHMYYPNTIVDVINQPAQFQPVRTGSIKTAVPDEVTIEAVLTALAGEDYSRGAEFFKMKYYHSAWFDSANLKYLFTHGAHAFYK